MQIYGTFYGYEQRTNVSCLFKIYATDQGLFGAWIADRDYEEMRTRFVGHSGQQNIDVTQKIAQDAAMWEQHYDSLELADPEFLRVRPENFHFRPNEVISSLIWKLKMPERTTTRYGALDLTASDGNQRRFYLVGRSTPAEVVSVIQSSMPATSIDKGTSSFKAFTLLTDSAKPKVSVTANSRYQRLNWGILIPVYLAAWILAFVLIARI
jgi:hypothetical protein